MKNKRILILLTVAVLSLTVLFAATACNTQEKIYDQIFTLCANQKNLAITVSQGDIVVYTYKDGVGHSDFEDVNIDASQYIQAGENAGMKFKAEDFTSDSQIVYDDTNGSFEIKGKLANPASLLGLNVADVSVNIKGNYMQGTVEIYTVRYAHNGFDVVVTLV